jgi:chemotaxis protein MotB
MDAVSAELRLEGNDIRVDGHTDSTPIDSPRYPTNWELSVARALAVTRYLTESDGVPAGRLMAAGFGEFRPLMANDSREHRAMNRRVEIHLLSSSVTTTTTTTTTTTPTEHLDP